MLNPEASCSATYHTDCEFGVLAKSIIVTRMVSAHLCDLVQRRGPPSGTEARSGRREIRQHLFEVGLVESSSILLQLHFTVNLVSLCRVAHVDDPT